MSHNRKLLNIDFVREKFSERGYLLQEDTYVNSQYKMKYICNKGHPNAISWNNFKKGAGCFQCNGKIKPTYEHVKREFEKQGCSLLSDTYINAKTKLKYLCPNGHYCELTWDHFNRKGYTCKKCTGNEKHTYEYIRKQFENEGCTLLTGFYENAHQILEYICPFGHKCKVRYNKFQQGDRCRKCADKNIGDLKRKSRKDLEIEVYELVQNEYTVLGNYVNIDTPLLMKHNECGNEWEVVPYGFLKQGTRCPKCSSSYGERLICDYLKNINIKFLTQYKIEGCLNSRLLRFDFAIFKENNLMFLLEFDGQQHFEPIEFFGGDKGFKESQKRDQIKNTYCKENNIKLVRIPYWEINNIVSILESHLKEV